MCGSRSPVRCMSAIGVPDITRRCRHGSDSDAGAERFSGALRYVLDSNPGCGRMAGTRGRLDSSRRRRRASDSGAGFGNCPASFRGRRARLLYRPNHLERPADDFTTPFGVRQIAYDVDKGFLLNGQRVKMQGMCIHHDGGSVGAAVPLGVWVRRLQECATWAAMRSG